MPIACRLKRTRGSHFCNGDCPVAAQPSAFEVVRIEQPSDAPAADPSAVDVAVLDMNHGWAEPGPRLAGPRRAGRGLRRAAGSRQPPACACACSRSTCAAAAWCPSRPPRFALYLGTGGPGHLDPHLNDGESPGSQGMRRGPVLGGAHLRALRRHPAPRPTRRCSAVCHTFGVMCRWSGAAESVLRAAAEGRQERGHPRERAHAGGAGPPLVRAAWPTSCRSGGACAWSTTGCSTSSPAARCRAGAMPIGFETLGLGGPPGDGAHHDGVRARRRGDVMPRVFGVNHHPEIVDRVAPAHDPGAEARARRGHRRVVRRPHADARASTRTTRQRPRLHLTSDFTLLGPLRFHLYRAAAAAGPRSWARLDVDCRRSTEAAGCAEAGAALCAGATEPRRDPQAAVSGRPDPRAGDRRVRAPEAPPDRGVGHRPHARGGAPHLGGGALPHARPGRAAQAARA